MGSPTAIVKTLINERGGDELKIENEIRQCELRIEEEQEKIVQFRNALKVRKEEEEKALKQAQEELKAKKEQDGEGKKKKRVTKALSLEEWVIKWKPKFKEKIEHQELLDQEYEIIMVKMSFKSRDEVKAWLNGG